MPEPALAEAHHLEQLRKHLELLYAEQDVSGLVQQICELFEPIRSPSSAETARGAWTEQDCMLITYGDSIVSDDEPPLATLTRFLSDDCQACISNVHVLPFYPFSSDDGFSVIDYTAVREDLGDWSHIRALAAEFRLMVDLVINHVSSKSEWFTRYCQGDPSYAGYFIESKLGDDLSQVVRPRTSPLLRATQTADGVKQLWCTFSHDQVDVNFANPSVLLEYLKIIALYLQQGAQTIRLDAIGYLWKEPGTSCIHLPQTHEVVRLLRTICDFYAPGTALITETNVPNHENLTYFGNRNEAHAIYNFSLAPLLVHALLTGCTHYLNRWLMSMPPAPDGCAYLNFTASHDGIGMRPAEGLLNDHEQAELVETIRRHGGMFSTRQTADGSERIYELNVSLFDALRGTVEREDDLQIERFLCSQTVMLGVEGLPAFYIHSLLATPNDLQAVETSGRPRSINRHRWNYADLRSRLSDPNSAQSIVLRELLHRLQTRCRQLAFHPNATQFTLQFANPLFGFWRQSRDRQQSIFAVHNMSCETQELRLSELNLIAGDSWRDLLTNQTFADRSATVSLAPYQCMWISNRSF